MQAKMIDRSAMENLWPPCLQNSRGTKNKQTNKTKKGARFIAEAELL